MVTDNRKAKERTPGAQRMSQKQLDKFKEAARELETDDREEAFDEKLKRVAKAPTAPRDKPNGR